MSALPSKDTWATVNPVLVRPKDVSSIKGHSNVPIKKPMSKIQMALLSTKLTGSHKRTLGVSII